MRSCLTTHFCLHNSNHNANCEIAVLFFRLLIIGDIMDILNAFKNTISLFNIGQANKIFESVKKNGVRIVLKNNTPECILLSPEYYIQLVEQLNDAKLLLLANERMSKLDDDKVMTQKEFNEKFGINSDRVEYCLSQFIRITN